MSKIIRCIKKEMWPLDEFRDCSKGTALQKYNAHIFNKSQSDILIIPSLNWIVFILFDMLMMRVFEGLSNYIFQMKYVVAIFGIMFSIGVVGWTIIIIGLLFLKAQQVGKFSYNKAEDNWFN